MEESPTVYKPDPKSYSVEQVLAMDIEALCSLRIVREVRERLRISEYMNREQLKVIHELRDDIAVLEAKNKALRDECKKLRQNKQ